MACRITPSSPWRAMDRPRRATTASWHTGARTSTARRKRTVEESGFLPDYSQLREGGTGEAQLVYIKPGVAWARYTKIKIDPVTIWTSGDSTVASVSEADRQLLADYLDASLRNSLQQHYTLLDRAEANTLRLRGAITDAKGARVALNTVSKIVPQLRLLTTV